MTSGGRVWTWTAVVGAAGAVLTVALWANRGLPAHPRSSWWALPVFSVLLATAERLRIKVRVGSQVDAVNLVESILAPLLFFYPALLVVAVVASAQLISSAVRRGELVKNVFNLAQWVLTAACGALIMQYSGRYGALTAGRLLWLLAAVAAVGVVNIGVLVVVLALARSQSIAELVAAMKRSMAVVWAGSWAINVAIGFIYLFAFYGDRWAIVLFAVPLVVLHLAYRGMAAVTADQQRLAGLHEAAQALAAPLDPVEGIRAFLESVASCFEARAASLVLDRGDTRQVHTWDRTVTAGYTLAEQPSRDATLEGTLSTLPGPVQITPRQKDPVAEMVHLRGWHDCLSAPLVDEGRRTGCLIVIDQDGVEGSARGELAVLEALARETAGTFSKGRLLADVLDERRKMSELIGSTSDGMLSLAPDGAPAAWNPAIERITGVTAREALGNPAVVLRLRPQSLDGREVDLTRWSELPALPSELRVTAADGTTRRLSCSYSRVADDGGDPRALVVVARDVTAHEEMEALRQEFDRLAEEQRAARAVVEKLQEAVVPPAPDVPQVELAVEYVPSDDVAPTGGDLYDWHVLPDGDIHLAVVDVLGHGVSATKAALSVMHTLRVVAAEGTPLVDIIARVDSLMQVQEPDLVATAVVARYTPATGRLRVASGGHPPGLVLRGDGSVSLVDATGSTIGWPGASSDAVSELFLEVGETLLLYTDGLVEARKDMLRGLEYLVAYAGSTSRLPTSEVPSSLVGRMLAGAQRRDDTLALVLRRSMSEERFFTTVAPTLSEVRVTRVRLGWWLAERGFDAEDAVSVAAELLANAVRSARTWVRLDARLTGRVDGAGARLSLHVADDGPGDPLLATRGMFAPGGDAEEGRGLFIVRTLCSGLDISSTAAGTSITATVGLRRGSAAGPAGSAGEAAGGSGAVRG